MKAVGQAAVLVFQDPDPVEGRAQGGLEAQNAPRGRHGDALGGQGADAPSLDQVTVGVEAAAAIGSGWTQKALAVVLAQGLGVELRQLGGSSDGMAGQSLDLGRRGLVG